MIMINQYGTTGRVDYFIPAHRVADFEAAIAKVSKKAEKIIGEPILAIPLGWELVEVKNAWVRMHHFHVTVYDLKFSGWEFVASIDSYKDDRNVIRSIPGKTIPEKYRTSGCTCEHCNINRYRRNTYVLMNEETGEYKQVGSSCLKDFLGHNLPGLASYFEDMDALSQDWNDTEPGMEYCQFPLDEYLAHVACMIRHYGWVSGAKAYDNEELTSTANDAFSNYLDIYDARNKEPDIPQDCDFDMAEDAIAWFKQSVKTKETLSDYEHNVNVMIDETHIPHRAMGTMASVVGIYMTKIIPGKAAKKYDFSNSKYIVGFADKKKPNITRLAETVTLVSETVISGYYGTSYLYKFITDDGNLVTWFASSPQGIAAHARFEMAATIKKHEVFKGVKQTVVNRAKLKVITK